MTERARYAIDVDPARGLVRLTLSGFFRREDYDAFAHERARKQALLAGRPFRTLADIRGLAIQSQEIVAAFQARVEGTVIRAQQVAFVVAPTLTRHQLSRVIAKRDARCFRTPEAAEAWLLDDVRAAA